MTDVAKWTAYLLDAERDRRAVEPITLTDPGLDAADAYRVQDAIIAAKVAGGDRVVGAKLGLTSKAKQQAMNVDEPVYAQLTSSMTLPGEVPLQVSSLIHPRVEPEIVFLLGAPLAGPGVCAHDVLEATAAITCGLEVIDSRYADFKFTLPDVAADNASSARYVLGSTWIDPHSADLALIGCVYEHNGDVFATASGAAVLGHPAEAVALLANFVGSRGGRLEEGWIVLSGGLTNAVAVAPGDHVTATFGRLGTVRLACV